MPQYSTQPRSRFRFEFTGAFTAQVLEFRVVTSNPMEIGATPDVTPAVTEVDNEKVRPYEICHCDGGAWPLFGDSAGTGRRKQRFAPIQGMY